MASSDRWTNKVAEELTIREGPEYLTKKYEQNFVKN